MASLWFVITGGRFAWCFFLLRENIFGLHVLIRSEHKLYNIWYLPSPHTIRLWFFHGIDFNILLKSPQWIDHKKSERFFNIMISKTTYKRSIQNVDNLENAHLNKNVVVAIKLFPTGSSPSNGCEFHDKVYLLGQLNTQLYKLCLYTSCIGECPSNSPFLKNNGAEALCF